MKALTIEFVPYYEIEDLDSDQRINKLLKIVKDQRIIMLEGRLRRPEEANLIAATMSAIDDTFKGIELVVVDDDKTADDFIKKMKKRFLTLLLGDRKGFTIIGPATVVKEIKRDPNKIQLLTAEVREKKRKTRKRKK